jgi:hypothetical protein
MYKTMPTAEKWLIFKGNEKNLLTRLQKKTKDKRCYLRLSMYHWDHAKVMKQWLKVE